MLPSILFIKFKNNSLLLGLGNLIFSLVKDNDCASLLVIKIGIVFLFDNF